MSSDATRRKQRTRARPGRDRPGRAAVKLGVARVELRDIALLTRSPSFTFSSRSVRPLRGDLHATDDRRRACGPSVSLTAARQRATTDQSGRRAKTARAGRSAVRMSSSGSLRRSEARIPGGGARRARSRAAAGRSRVDPDAPADHAGREDHRSSRAARSAARGSTSANVPSVVLAHDARTKGGCREIAEGLVVDGRRRPRARAA